MILGHRPKSFRHGHDVVEQRQDERYSSNPRSRSGTKPARSNSSPCARAAWRHRRHPRSSSPGVPGQRSICSVHHSTLRATRPSGEDRDPWGFSVVRAVDDDAAAAWSWVEKMLQLTHRTSAPRRQCSISTRSGSSCGAIRDARSFEWFVSPNSRACHQAGISCSRALFRRDRNRPVKVATLKLKVAESWFS